MIGQIKAWCEGIIVAIIISIIIEMIIPNGKNKKYIKVIIGIYIMYVCISPMLKLLKSDIEFDEIFKTNTVETSQNFDSQIKDVYISGIESSLKIEIENLGYVVEYLKIYIDSNYENIEKIELKIKEKNNQISPVVIGEDKNKESYEDIIALIEENYSVSKENILFI